MTDRIPRNTAVTIRFLRLMRRKTYDGMAKLLNATKGRIVQKSKGAIVGSSLLYMKSVQSLEEGKDAKIWHLGRYANLEQMPNGALLFLSQLSAHLRDGDTDLAKGFAEAMVAACKEAILIANSIDEKTYFRDLHRQLPVELQSIIREDPLGTWSVSLPGGSGPSPAIEPPLATSDIHQIIIIGTLVSVFKKIMEPIREAYQRHIDRTFTDRPRIDKKSWDRNFDKSVIKPEEVVITSTSQRHQRHT
jgi:hypothetical protein